MISTRSFVALNKNAAVKICDMICEVEDRKKPAWKALQGLDLFISALEDTMASSEAERRLFSVLHAFAVEARTALVRLLEQEGSGVFPVASSRPVALVS